MARQSKKARVVKPDVTAYPTKGIDSVTWYSKPTKYSDGERLTWSTFPYSEKDYKKILPETKVRINGNLKAEINNYRFYSVYGNQKEL